MKNAVRRSNMIGDMCMELCLCTVQSLETARSDVPHARPVILDLAIGSRQKHVGLPLSVWHHLRIENFRG